MLPQVLWHVVNLSISHNLNTIKEREDHVQ